MTKGIIFHIIFNILYIIIVIYQIVNYEYDVEARLRILQWFFVLQFFALIFCHANGWYNHKSISKHSKTK